ncbi:MAG: hypothetical protein QG665_407 [Patescibacteria group bacterium]|nr:hypothetical protein [Patescibacteria group bacterium]
MEQKISQHIEAEIAELEERIAEKRRNLESEQSIVDDRQLVGEVVTDLRSAPRVVQLPPDEGDKSYLDSLPEEVEAQVEYLVDQLFKKGVAWTIKQSKKLPALEQDAFHDTLVEKLYTELKNRGLIS